ncbi:MAG: hypothetical protein WCO63_06445 [Bacteroidota bacterium]
MQRFYFLRLPEPAVSADVKSITSHAQDSWMESALNATIHKPLLLLSRTTLSMAYLLPQTIPASGRSGESKSPAQAVL